MRNSDEDVTFSKENSINCFIRASAYVGARAMFSGNLTTVTETYGAVMNPAIALGIQMSTLFNYGLDAWKSVYLYPTVPFGAAFLAVLFYELVYKKA